MEQKTLEFTINDIHYTCYLTNNLFIRAIYGPEYTEWCSNNIQLKNTSELDYTPENIFQILSDSHHGKLDKSITINFPNIGYGCLPLTIEFITQFPYMAEKKSSIEIEYVDLDQFELLKKSTNYTHSVLEERINKLECRVDELENYMTEQPVVINNALNYLNDRFNEVSMTRIDLDAIIYRLNDLDKKINSACSMNSVLETELLNCINRINTLEQSPKIHSEGGFF